MRLGVWQDPSEKWFKTKRRVHALLEIATVGDMAARRVERLLIGLIIVNVTVAVLETVPSLNAGFRPLLSVLDVVTVAAFVVEYCFRFWVADVAGPFARRGALRGRLAWALTPTALIDLAAIVPALLAAVLGWEGTPFAVFRMVRFLKFARYSPGISSLITAIAAERRALAASGVVMLGLVLVTASLMYTLEGRAQPERFGTIPLAMYWAVTTLATVGYGDVVPVTSAGKIVAMTTMVLGFCTFALPVGLIATAFTREMQQRDFVLRLGMVARIPAFADLSTAEIADVMRLLDAHTVPADTVIRSPDQAAEGLSFIGSGSVEMRTEDGVERLTDGMHYGAEAILRTAPRPAEVVALTSVRLLVLSAAGFAELMRRQPRVAERLRRLALDEVQEHAAPSPSTPAP